MPKQKKSRFDGLTFDQLNQDAAAVTQPQARTAAPTPTPEKRGKGRPKTSNRKPFNTALDPAHKQRLEVLAMLQGGSVADQLHRILDHYFAEVEQVDELVTALAAQKQQRQPDAS